MIPKKENARTERFKCHRRDTKLCYFNSENKKKMSKKKPSYNNTAAEEHKVISFKSDWSSLKLKSTFELQWGILRDILPHLEVRKGFWFHDLFVPSVLHLGPNLKRAEQTHKCSRLITTPIPPSIFQLRRLFRKGKAFNDCLGLNPDVPWCPCICHNGFWAIWIYTQ